MGGAKQKETLNELSGWLSGTANKKYTDYVEKKTKATNSKSGKVFIQIKVSTSNAEEKAAKLRDILSKTNEAFDKNSEEDGGFVKRIPQIKAIDNNIFIGLEFIQTERRLYGVRI